MDSILSNKMYLSTCGKLRKQLNFYRIHILFFTFTPLIFSGIFYASNGRYKISYIDSLFNCTSAITVCGLATIDLSSLTGWQQAILFLQMAMGSPVVVSWVMVFIRRYYFARKFQHIIESAVSRSESKTLEESGKLKWANRMLAAFDFHSTAAVAEEETEKPRPSKREKGGIIPKLRPDMIRRMDDAPKLVDPNGWISPGNPNSKGSSVISESREDREQQPPVEPKITEETILQRKRRLSDPGTTSRPSSPVKGSMHRYDTVTDPTTRNRDRFPRMQTVEFAPTAGARRRRGSTLRGSELERISEPSERRSARGHPLARNMTYASGRTHVTHRRVKHSEFGGFPMPLDILNYLAEKLFPTLKSKLERTLTVPATMSYAPTYHDRREGAKQVPYITFDAVVGRNSKFHLLTSDQLEEIGGVEYRALNALLWIVALYHFGLQMICFTIIAPYMSLSKWKDVFVPPQQHRPITSTWFSAFQVVSSYTNTGMSLVDQSMLPFQKAYPMIICMIILILAGNTSFPIFLRFMIWVISKLVPKNSRASETLHFLLDHPRRCFIYLFPSHQTWFLLTVVLGLTFTDWFFFMVLDIGNDAIEQVPLNVRFIVGLLQAAAVRAAGFAAVPLSALAPAVKLLYVIMMYISVYPIAMSVRSTNVYEERSLGIFGDEEGEVEEEDFEPEGSRMTVWSRYLAMHARKQLAFDMWWLGLALFLVCIIERHNIVNDNNLGWFNIFTILFELVSAYGTVGLSLGMPTQNYSLSGAFHPLSKLVVCAVMLRGRHRGLPVAIDRAVMLPSEFENTLREDTPENDESQMQGNTDNDMKSDQQ